MFIQPAAPLFLLPFFLFGGVALQAAGLYLFGILLPLISFMAAVTPRVRDFPFMKLGQALLVMWFVFVVANFAASFIPPVPPGRMQTLFALLRKQPLALFESRFSSSIALSGVLLCVSGLLLRHAGRPASPLQRGQDRASTLYRAFVLGAACATILLFTYAMYQHFTGFDMRAPSHRLLPEHRMASGRFRVFGFYGHPLSIAGVGLAFFCFFWVQFWEWIANTTVGRSQSGAQLAPFPVARREWGFGALLGFASLLHFIILVTSGGRTALGIGALLFVAIPLGTPLPAALARWRVGALAGLGLLLGAAFYFSGAMARYREFLDSVSRGIGFDRLTFWKVHLRMFLDKPFFGQGSYWLDHGVRDAYYVRMGHSALQDKFNAHNLFLEILACAGVVGFLVLAIALWRVRGVLKGFSYARPSGLLLQRGLVWALLGNMLHGATQNTFFDSNVVLTYLALLWVFVWCAISPEVSSA